MSSYFKYTAATFLLLITAVAVAQTNKEAGKPISIGPFGSKPIQLSIDKDGIKKRKEPGHICDLTAAVTGTHYSEWGETESDARTIVTKKCSGDSGLLLCKKEKAICREDKP